MSKSVALLKREEKRYTLYGFRGLDLASSEGEIAGYRSPNSCNFVNENGINRKRKGWKQFYGFENSVYKASVDGLFTLEKKGGNYLLAYVSFYYKTSKIPPVANKEKGVFAFSTFMLRGPSGTFYDALEDKKEIRARLLPKKPNMYLYGNKAYFMGMGDFLVFDKENMTFKRVEEDEETYVPTTTVSVDNDSVTDTVRATLEEANVLTRRRKNTLVGVDQVGGAEVGEENPLTFTLDSTLSAFDKVKVKIETRNSVGAVREIKLTQSLLDAERNLALKDKIGGKTLNFNESALETLPEYLSGFITTQPLIICSDGYFMLEQNERGINFFYVGDCYTEDNAKGKRPDDYDGEDIISLISHGQVLDALSSFQLPDGSGEVIWINEKAFAPLTLYSLLYSGLTCNLPTYDRYLYGADRESGINTLWGELVGSYPCYHSIKIVKPCLGALADLSNITVEFSTPYQGGESDTASMEFGVIYGEKGRRNRLFFKGKEENILRFSQIGDFSYVPALSYVICGGSQSEISGLMPLDDYSLAVFKKGFDSKVYILKEYPLEGENLSQTAFYTKSGHVAEGCVSPRCVANFGGDFIYLSQHGVYGLNSSGDTSETRRFSGLRSRLVNPALEKEDYTTASLYLFGNRLLLSYANGNCYLADSGFKFSEKADGDSFNYEWWKLENIPINCLTEENGEVIFGTTFGGICRFDKGFIDQSWTLGGIGELALSGDGKISFNPKLCDFEEGDTVIVSGPFGQDEEGGDCYALLADGDKWFDEAEILKVEERRIFVAPPLLSKFYTGREVLVDSGGNNDWAYYVRDLDEESCSFLLVDKNGKIWSGMDVGGFSLCTRLEKGGRYTVFNLDKENNTFGLKDVRGEELKLVDFGTMVTSLYLKFVKEKTVCALWETPVLDMGYPYRTKGLSGLVFVLDKDKGGSLTFGYETATRKASGEREIGGFDFERLDFNRFSFSSNFTATLAVPMKVRSFENIKIFFSSNTPTPCAVEKIIMKYKVKGFSRGLN